MAEKPKDIETIYSAALKKLSESERKAYLDAVCGDDHALRVRVEELLKANSEAGDFLKIPSSGADITLDKSPALEGPGTKIGRYKLLELIGEGGMGLVYLAEQAEPVRRRVALKVIKPGMDSKEVIARFESERQALALLDHPNIAHVFDAGTTDSGRPYFVMEYVKGMSITRYCDEHRLNIEQRLKLFREVCEGVHHAHQKGIIHRDIKPSNILISLHGDRAVPKIIDFGIAKAAVSTLTEKTIFTFHGQLLGTPEYMSPEQVDLATQDIDTRSDIYSLGVVLYELLSGVLPFEIESLHKIGLAELQHTIRELEPASPSIRLSNLGQQAKVIADNRMTQVVPLARRLHRELEWIPLKAMRKDRCRRYKSASDMADDIQNYINGNPLIAGPETAVYRVKKFVHKHAGSVTTVALVSLTVILGLVVSIAFGQRAEQARQQEVAARVEAEQARDEEIALRKQLEQALARAEQAERIAQQQRELAEEQAEAYRRAVYGNTLAQAQGAIDDVRFSRAQELLNSCESDLRGWEWYRLNYLSTDPCVRTFRGHSNIITRVAVSPDGTRIASASHGEGIIKLWDTTTGIDVITLKGHENWIWALAFSPDGKRIISGGWDKTIRVWDVDTGSELMTLKGHEEAVNSAMYSPDGNCIVSGGDDGMIRIWDANTGTDVMTFKGHKTWIWTLAFSPDSKRIVSGSRDNTIKVWDTDTGAELMTLQGHEGAVRSAMFSPDGSRIVSCGGDNTVRVWDAKTGDEIKILTGHNNAIYSVAFSPDGKLIASGSADNTIKIWDAATWNELTTLRGHTDGITSVVFGPDSNRIFSAGADRVIKEWDIAADRDVLRLYGTNPGTSQVAFSTDGKYIAAAIFGTVKLWDAISGAEIIAILGNQGWINSIAFSPDGRRIASGSADNTVKVWNAATGAMEMALVGNREGVRSVTFSPDGRRIVSGSRDKTIRIWNAETGAMEMALIGHREGVRSVTYSPDGERIVSAGDDGTVRIWDALSGEQLQILLGHEGSVHSVSVSSNGNRIASCSEDKTIKIWEAATGAELMTLRGHESLVSTVAFSPDGRRIISGDHNRVIKIWDADTGAELMTLYGDSTTISSAVFSPDGKSICVSYENGYATIWESVDPVAGYGPRRIVNSATVMVDALYDQYGFYGDVISQLTERNIDEAVHKMALQISNARLCQDVINLELQCRQLLNSPDANEATYRELIEKLERAASLNPTKNNFYLHNMGIAQYRLGDYEEALATLERVWKTVGGEAGGTPTNPWVSAYIAMTLKQLDRETEADAVFQRMLRTIRNRRWNASNTPDVQLVSEVGILFASEGSTLRSIWEFIGEDELDSAAELVEMVRLSKDAGAISRMEDAGAAELLGMMYYRRAVERWKDGGALFEQIVDYERVVHIDPNNVEALTELARILVNWPSSKPSDNQKAVETATRACELTVWKDHEAISTLAAAYSQIGDFNNAVKWQQEAVNLIPVERRVELETEYQERLRSYESGKPYRESP